MTLHPEPTPDPGSRDDLREHLVRTRIAGDVATSRENNLDHYRSLANRDPHHMFGLTLGEGWSYRDVLDLMAKSAGVVADPAHREGRDTIDPDRTIDAVEAMGDVIAGVLRSAGARILVATGHPTGLLTVHLALARLARERGATLLTPAEDWSYTGPRFGRRRKIRYLDDVAMLDDRGAFVHTHDPAPMEAMIAEMGEERPDLVIADHGWAGAAGEAGIPTVGFADSNDPALFVGEAEGKIAVTVPLDDNVLPRHYAPLTAHLVARVASAL
ncbi:phosphatase [Planomonospora parontospora]|uniref:phosphatase n=1 Tax=Planomonospora parontospora TaxID=58119 RepID=UPI0019A5C4E3|nr:phosphatase [Planomonospora parontospora]GGL36421.1 putative phosphatase [Planomonospora parontospora subsp. antibiotica]GII17369.1 putative phosphatase [Planomonospora parontospora subsp. antibiotica]